MDPLAHDLLDLWFGDWTDDEPAPTNGGPQMALWWGADPDTDADLRTRFGDAARDALDGGLDDWCEDATTVVALVLLLDQIPRSIHRGTPAAFASDAKARDVCKGAIAAGLDRRMPYAYRYFLYMPLMHSEKLADHDLAVKKFGEIVTEAARHDSYRIDAYKSALEYEHKHRDIIEQFGRYPHRNAILGRDSTPEELSFLAKPGSSF